MPKKEAISVAGLAKLMPAAKRAKLAPLTPKVNNTCAGLKTVLPTPKVRLSVELIPIGVRVLASLKSRASTETIAVLAAGSIS